MSLPKPKAKSTIELFRLESAFVMMNEAADRLANANEPVFAGRLRSLALELDALRSRVTPSL